MNAMESEQPRRPHKSGQFESLKSVTPLSKYLAMALFVALPFIGGWVGYQLAPVEVVEVHRVIERETGDRDANASGSIGIAESIRNEGEPVATLSDASDDERYELYGLGTLSVPTRDGTITRKYFYSWKPELEVVAVYYYTEPYGGEPRYEIERVYPDTYSKEDIIADLNGDDPIVFSLPEGIPDPENYTDESNFLTDEGEDLSAFIRRADACSQYMGGNGCTIEVLSNTHDLVPGTLDQETGPYMWGRTMTLVEVRVMSEGRLFMVWGFGDAGARAVNYSIWDTVNETHTRVSGFSGLIGESMTITIGEDASRAFRILTSGANDDSGGTAVNTFDGDMFGDLLHALLPDPPSSCIDVEAIPKDRTDPNAPWLLEYSYGCYTVGNDLAFRYYELDPVAGTAQSFGDVIYR